jgi:hypothetical protein
LYKRYKKRYLIYTIGYRKNYAKIPLAQNDWNENQEMDLFAYFSAKAFLASRNNKSYLEQPIQFPYYNIYFSLSILSTGQSFK